LHASPALIARRVRPARLKRRPVQARSARTLELLLDAAERLLESRSFDDLTMADLAAEAGIAVGTIYTRFESRDAILPYLYERYQQDLHRRVDEHLDTGRLAGLDLRARVKHIVDFAVRLYRARRGLWRAVALYACRTPGAISVEHRHRRGVMLERCAALLIECRAEIAHPDPRRAVAFALSAVIAICKDRILFDDAIGGMYPALSDRQLKGELVRVMCRYLGVEGH